MENSNEIYEIPLLGVKLGISIGNIHSKGQIGQGISIFIGNIQWAQVREEEVSHLTTIDEDPQLNAMEEGYTKSCIKCSEAIFRRHYHE